LDWNGWDGIFEEFSNKHRLQESEYHGMSATEKRKIRVFIVSPSDLAEERRVFRSAIDVLNIGFGDGANVEFVALGWECIVMCK
jgi:hypothetical protein